MKVGKVIRGMRKARKMAQTDLAEATGIWQSRISDIETGRHAPQIATLERIAEALGVSVADFFEESIPKGPPPPPKAPLTDEIAEAFDERFAKTTESSAAALKKDLDTEFAALQRYVRALKNAGINEGDFTLRQARIKFRRNQERLYALSFREQDLASEERMPKNSVAEYVPSSKETEELARMILGAEAARRSEAS